MAWSRLFTASAFAAKLYPGQRLWQGCATGILQNPLPRFSFLVSFADQRGKIHDVDIVPLIGSKTLVAWAEDGDQTRIGHGLDAAEQVDQSPVLQNIALVARTWSEQYLGRFFCLENDSVGRFASHFRRT